MSLDTQQLIADFKQTLTPISLTSLFNNVNAITDTAIEIACDQVCQEMKILETTMVMSSVAGVLTDLERLSYTGPNDYGLVPIWATLRKDVCRYYAMNSIISLNPAPST